MLLGRAGQLPAPVDEEIRKLACEQRREFFTGNAQDLYPDELELFARKMDEKGWDYGEDDEELMEYAMHPGQYEDFMSGKAKQLFLEDLNKRKAAKSPPSSPATFAPPPVSVQPKSMTIDVDGELFQVTVSYSQKGKPLRQPYQRNWKRHPPPPASCF